MLTMPSGAFDIANDMVDVAIPTIDITTRIICAARGPVGDAWGVVGVGNGFVDGAGNKEHPANVNLDDDIGKVDCARGSAGDVDDCFCTGNGFVDDDNEVFDGGNGFLFFWRGFVLIKFACRKTVFEWVLLLNKQLVVEIKL